MAELNQPARFQIALRIQPEDIDELNHVNNAVYLRWVQQAAVAHWRSIAPAGMQAAMLWVVLRHEIDYKAPARLGDDIAAETWVGAATKITFERFTEIRRVSDSQLLAQARTLWCPIDPETQRPRRVEPEVRALFSV